MSDADLGLPTIRQAEEADSEFIYQLAAYNDLRWPLATRFHGGLHPQHVITQIAANVELAWIVAEASGEPVGAIGFVEADNTARMVLLDAVAMPGDRARNLVAGAIPGLIDIAIAHEEIHRIHFEYYEELGQPMISAHIDLWEREVVIPEFARIDGIWCTRVTCTLDPHRWATARSLAASAT